MTVAMGLCLLDPRIQNCGPNSIRCISISRDLTVADDLFHHVSQGGALVLSDLLRLHFPKKQYNLILKLYSGFTFRSEDPESTALRLRDTACAILFSVMRDLALCGRNNQIHHWLQSIANPSRIDVPIP